jgi:N-acetylglucosaminyldiphosphoundecaprenol N-acetyl-beta-D-mannosaminyltransferase
MSYRNRRSAAVLGMPFDNVTMHEAMDLIAEKIEEQGFHQVATANVDFIVNAIHDQSLQEMLCSCDLVVPDGMPIVWASQLMGSKLKERVSGVDLIPRLAELAVKRRMESICWVQVRRARAGLPKYLRNASRIVGCHCPPVSPLAEMHHEGILRLSSVPNQTSCWLSWGTPSKSSGLPCIVTG